MLHKEQLPIGYARQARTKAAGKAPLVMLLGHSRLGLLPVHAVRRVGNLIAKGLIGHLVISKRVAQMHIGHVATFENGVALADGVGLTVDLLRVGDHRSGRVDLVYAVGEHRERATRPRAGITHLDDAIRLREVVHLANHQQARRQLEAIARTEMLSGGLVGDSEKRRMSSS